MVVHIVYKDGTRKRLDKVTSIDLLVDGRYCFQRHDKRLKDGFKEELIPANQVKAFYQCKKWIPEVEHGKRADGKDV